VRSNRTAYVNSGIDEDTLVHRAVKDFVIPSSIRGRFAESAGYSHSVFAGVSLKISTPTA